MKKTDELGERVIIPTLQSAVSGMVSGLLAMALLFAIGMDARAFRGGLLAGAAVAALTWWALLVHQFRDPANRVQDIHRFKLELTSNAGRTISFVDLPCSEAQLKQLAAGLLRGESLSEQSWTGHGRPFSRAEFRVLRGELLHRGLVQWRSDRFVNQGMILTSVGRAVFQKIGSPTLPGLHMAARQRTPAGGRVPTRVP